MNSSVHSQTMLLVRPPVTPVLRLGQWVVRQWGWVVLLVMGLAALNVFFKLGVVPVNDMDEARYGVSAWEMLQQRDFLVTTYGGQAEYWNLKPPLGYWLMALSFKVFGPTPFALRLPSALAALATVLVILLRGQHLLGRRVAALAALMFATGYGFLAHHGARSGDLDALLTLLLTLAAFELPLMAVSRWAMLRFGVFVALGLLLKSFAVLPVIAVAGAFLLLSGIWRKLHGGTAVAAMAIALLPTMLWAALRWHADGSPEFLHRMVREDLLARSTTRVDDLSYSPWSYALAIFDRFAPWPLLVVIAVGWLGWWCYRRRDISLLPVRGALLWWLALWALVPLVMFSIARTQHHWYMNPVYPAWAMLASLAVLQMLRVVAAAPAKQMLLLTMCVVVPLLGNEARLLYRVQRDVARATEQNKLEHLAQHRELLGKRVAIGSVSHSERFVLEVMHGYQVDESDNSDLNLPVWQAFREGRYEPSAGFVASLDAQNDQEVGDGKLMSVY